MALMQLLALALPLVKNAALIAEELHPNEGQGAAKLDQVVSIVEAALPAIGATIEQVAQLRAPLQAVTSAVVGGMNKAGVLKRRRAAKPHAATFGQPL